MLSESILKEFEEYSKIEERNKHKNLEKNIAKKITFL